MKQWLDNLAYWWLEIDPANVAFAARLDTKAIKAATIAYEAGKSMPFLGVYITDFGTLDIFAMERPDEKTTA